jgi:DNA-binding MarR family transcriptional regulator
MSTVEGEDLANLVREHSSAVIRHAAATAKRMGLEASELSALEHLRAAGPLLTLGQLGERLSMSPGAVTALVDRLEKKGYVERTPNPKDRRSALVRETGAGLEESLKHLWPYIEEMKGLEGVSPKRSGRLSPASNRLLRRRRPGMAARRSRTNGVGLFVRDSLDR